MSSSLLITSAAGIAQSSQWIQPLNAQDPLIWGRRDGIVFGLASPGGMKGPRGLIRVGVFKAGEATPQVLNYIAVEPVIKGEGDRYERMAFSELEESQLDPGLKGKRMWVHTPGTQTNLINHVRTGKAGIERLSVRIDVERFTANAAHVYIIASIESDHPMELQLSTFAEADSPPIEELTVTATMGNYERLRLLWLKNRVDDSRKLFPDYAGDDFADRETYPLTEMLRTRRKDAIVFCTTNEPDPGATPGNDRAHWVYTLPKYTQYWRVPRHNVQPDLRVRINARRLYWNSKALVLGGIAFENFEVREKFVPGQRFIFGITRLEPWQFYDGKSRLSPVIDSDPPTKAAGRAGSSFFLLPGSVDGRELR